MNIRHKLMASATLIAGLCLVLALGADAGNGKKSPRVPRVMVLDGSPVHDVGNLLVHVPNWGIFGSMPTASTSFSAAPSAEWPAGSGAEYLYVAGLWVGALEGGVPAVSTAAFESEFQPTDDPVDVVYYAAEGDPGGNRIPDPAEMTGRCLFKT